MMMGTRRSSLRISGTVSSPFISGFDIEQNDIRAQLSKFRQRQADIAGRAYHFERGMAWRAGTPEARFYFPFIRNSPSFNRPVTLRK